MFSAFIYPALLPPTNSGGVDLASAVGDRKKVEHFMPIQCRNCDWGIGEACTTEDCGWWYDLWNPCCDSEDANTFSFACFGCGR